MLTTRRELTVISFLLWMAFSRTAFAGNGFVTREIGDYLGVDGLVMLSDQRMMVSGTSLIMNMKAGTHREEKFVALLSSEGKLVPGFGVEGIVREKAFSRPRVLPHGGILFAGTTDIRGNNPAFRLARYTPEGTPDLKFGDRGSVVLDFGRYEDQAHFTVPLPDGGFVAVGWSRESPGKEPPEQWRAPNRLALARFSSAGTLIPSFGKDGKLLISMGSGAHIEAAYLLPNGKIQLLVLPQPAESVGKLPDGDSIKIVRIDLNGVLDTAFGVKGVKSLAWVDMGDTTFLRCSYVADDGSFYVAPYGGKTSRLVRATSEGDPDPSFGKGGEVSPPFAVDGITLDSLGRPILTAIESPLDSMKMRFAVARLEKNGALDLSFGKKRIRLDPVGGLRDVGTATVSTSSGKIYVAARTSLGDQEAQSLAAGKKMKLALFRLMPDGALDLSFPASK